MTFKYSTVRKFFLLEDNANAFQKGLVFNETCTDFIQVSVSYIKLVV